MPKPPSKRPGRDLTKQSGSDLAKRPGSAPVVVPHERPLAVFDQALPKSVVDAFAFGNHMELAAVAQQTSCYTVGPDGVPIAKRIRAKNINLLESADQANRVLERVLSVKLDREIAVEMIGTMLDGFGAKRDEKVLMAMLDLLEGDDIARALQSYYISRACEPDYNRTPSEPMWHPIKATPTSLALACRTLNATSPKYVPKPVEFGNAVRTAQTQLRRAQQNCETVVEILQIADAVMLEFAPREEWIKPWQPPHMQTAFVRMLRLHEKYGDAREQYPGQSLMKGLDGNYYEDEDGNECNGLTEFGVLVKREQMSFKALMGPVEFKRIGAQINAADKVELLQAPAQPAQLQAPAQPKRIAAARKRSETKTKRAGRKAHKEELRQRPPLGPQMDGLDNAEQEHALINRDVPAREIDEAELEQIGWGGYGIEHGQVSPEFKITAEDDGDGDGEI